MSRNSKIEELEQKLASMKEQRDGIIAETDSLAGKRDNLNDQYRKMRGEISDLKGKRDELNQKVRELKQGRNAAKENIQQEIEELRGLSQEAKALRTKTPSESHQALRTKLESLEWKIQTTSLDLQEEKELLERVRQVERKLSIYRKLQQVDEKIRDLRNKLKASDTDAKLDHQRLTQIAQQSQEIHGRVLTKIEEAKRIKADADSLHQTFVQSMDDLRSTRQEMDGILSQINHLRSEAREQEEKEKKDAEATLRNQIETKAREKLKRGGKLSWEEFQLLAEGGMETQD